MCVYKKFEHVARVRSDDFFFARRFSIGPRVYDNIIPTPIILHACTVRCHNNMSTAAAGNAFFRPTTAKTKRRPDLSRTAE